MRQEFKVGDIVHRFEPFNLSRAIPRSVVSTLRPQHDPEYLTYKLVLPSKHSSHDGDRYAGTQVCITSPEFIIESEYFGIFEQPLIAPDFQREYELMRKERDELGIEEFLKRRRYPWE